MPEQQSQLSPGVPLAVGCDAGGSSCKLGLVDPAGQVVGRIGFACAALARADEFLLPLYDAIDGLAGGRAICGIGVLLPGYLDERRSVPRLLINLRALEGVPVRGLLEERYRTRVELDIDRNGHALAEYWHGDPRKAQRLLHVAIGTGVGVGLVVDGEICRLTNDSVGELGHICLDPSGERCACGGSGCVETLVSRDGIGRIAKKLGLCEDLLAEHGPVEFPRELYLAARSGDSRAVAVFAEFGRLLGIALVSYANVFSPDRIVIGGGLSGAAEFFLPAAGRWLNAHWFDHSDKQIVLRKTAVGADAGVIGAATLVLRRFDRGGSNDRR